MTDYRPFFGRVPNRTGKSSFCGPAALAVVSGMDVRDIEQNILERRKGRGFGKRECEKITGMNVTEWRNIAEQELGLLCIRVDVPRVPSTIYGEDWWHDGRPITRVPTFARWLKVTAEARGNDVYLVVTATHYLLVCGGLVVDNQLRYPRIVTTAKHYSRARVYDSYCIMKPEGESRS